MHILPVDPSNTALFIDYCQTYGRENDESYLSAEDLAPEAFQPGPEEPTYLLLSADGKLVGAASLMIREFRAEKTARLRIFHNRGHEPEGYRQLLAALLPHCAGLETIFLFVSEDLSPARQAFAQVGFTIQRYSWILQRPPMTLADATFPAGYHLRPFEPGRDQQAWCQVRNTAFQAQLGYSELTPEQVERQTTRSDYFPGGMLMLYDGERAIGTVQAADDLDPTGAPSTWIYSLAILPEYQHRGLGRRLLRAAIAAGEQHSLHAHRASSTRRGGGGHALQVPRTSSTRRGGGGHGPPSTYLVVNAENDNAASLYFNEGFFKVQAVVCYQYEIK